MMNRRWMTSSTTRVFARSRSEISEQDSEKAAALTKLLPDAFLWSFAGKNGDLTALNFKPDPKFDAPSREARVFAAMEGTMVVQTKQKRIQQLKGNADARCRFWLRAVRQTRKGWDVRN